MSRVFILSLSDILSDVLADPDRFLWVNLQVEKLCELKLESSVSKALCERSKVSATTLNDLYHEMLDRISATDPVAYEVATRAFSWLLCMHEPLTSKPFLTAVSTFGSHESLDLSLPEVLSICSNLIVLDPELDIIRFAHSSFKEFLEARQEFDVIHSHGVATMGCLHACIHQPPADIEDELHPDKDFALYAAMYWPTHCSAASTSDNAQGTILASTLNEFVFLDDDDDDDDDTNFQFLDWLDTAQRASELLANDHVLKTKLNAVISSTLTPLFTACMYGLWNTFQAVIRRQDFEVDQGNSLEHTGLYLAANFGNHEIVRGLERGANIGVQCGKHGNALNAAAFGGNVAVAQILLSHEPGVHSPSILSTALDVSFLAGKEDIAELLLRNGVLISCQDDYDKIQEAASRAGFRKVLQYLTECFSNFSHTSSPPMPKSIEVAITKGNLRYLKKRFVGKGLQIAHPVATAALLGQHEITLLCLNEGFDIEEEGPFGTPLRSASLMGNESTARMLLERSANVNECGKFGDALQAAAMKGYLSIANLLIQYKANVNNTGGYYGTALQAAAYRGHRDMAKTLLDAGASIYLGGLYKDAANAAAAAGQAHIINLFFDQGYPYRKPALFDAIHATLCSMGDQPYNPRSRNLLQRALLDQRIYQKACKADIQSRAATAREAPVSIDQKVKSETDALGEFEFYEIFRKTRGVTILRGDDERSEYRAQRGQYRNLNLSARDTLKVAAAEDRAEVVQLIVRNIKPFTDGKFFSEALSSAAENGHVSVAETLMNVLCPKRRVSVFEIAEDRDYGSSTLLWASQYTEKEGVGLIIQGGCRGDHPSVVQYGLQLRDGPEREQLQCDALQHAARSNSTKVMEFLFQTGYALELDALSQALQIAAENGSKSVLACLFGSDHKKSLGIDHCRKAFTSAVMKR